VHGSLGLLSRRIVKNIPAIRDLETKLARYIRSYLSAYGRGDATEQELLVWVASAMGWLVGRLLDGNDLWGPHRWVDAISPSSGAEVLVPGHIVLEGLLIFGDSSKGGGQWWEPFYGSVRISETSDEILSYQLKFGDNARGLGNVGYNEHPKGWNWSQPEQWMFVFAKP
jgi:hypothetical protein